MHVYLFDSSKRPLRLPHSEVHYRICSISRSYTDCGLTRHPRPFEFDTVSLSFGDVDSYTIIEFVGSGKFSVVFRGISRRGPVAIKTYRSASVDYLKRELFFLHNVRDCPNVIQYIDFVHDSASYAISLITEFVNADRQRVLYPTFTIEDIRYYGYQLFVTLHAVHSRGIMHRDLKPDNLLIDHSEKKIKLIDWGLAEVYLPKQQYPPYVGTLRYRAPELMMGYRYYDYAVDIWAAGITLGEMLIRYPLFEGEVVEDVILRVSDLVSSTAIVDFAKKYGIEMGREFLSAMSVRMLPGWKTLFEGMRPEVRNDDACDLLQRLLVVDPAVRISAGEALCHPFFASLHNRDSSPTGREKLLDSDGGL
jgi:casein kinase II subunit alpha